MPRILLSTCFLFLLNQITIAQCGILVSYYNVKVCEGAYFYTGYASPAGSTWEWTGPNGFYSTNELLEIHNFQLKDVGIYKSCVTRPGCPTVACSENQLVISFKKRTDVNASICAGGSYTFPSGRVLTNTAANSTYLDTSVLPSAEIDERRNYCDSVIYTVLKVNDVIKTTVTEKTCTNKPYTLPDGRVISTAGSYQFTFNSKSPAGCDSILQINLTVDSVYKTTVTKKTCTNKPYTLPDGSIISAAGTYQYIFNLKSSRGCDSILQLTLTVDNVYRSVIDAFICKNQQYVLPDGKIVRDSGEYTTVLQSIHGCDSVVITKLKTFNGNNDGVFVPTAFTPNGDGINDIFKIHTVDPSQFGHLKIFNRWGQVVFSSADYTKGWNGTFNGRLPETGTYVYLLRAKNCGGIWQNYKGTVTILQ
jgi:gliding motility-associated-like protein